MKRAPVSFIPACASSSLPSFSFQSTSSAGALSMLNCAIIAGGAKPNCICPSKAMERERNMGGTSALSEKRMHAAFAAVCVSAAEKNMSGDPCPSLSTRVSGSDASAAFLAASRPAASTAKGTAFFAAFSAAPKGSIATAGASLPPYVAASAAGARPTTTCPYVASASASRPSTSPNASTCGSAPSDERSASLSSRTKDAAPPPPPRHSAARTSASSLRARRPSIKLSARRRELAKTVRQCSAHLRHGRLELGERSHSIRGVRVVEVDAFV
mmetsp:Transcript_6246/g.19987  ORF Transcript_6246/g.19987 Transcript_6246/m.19987 type:complete len:271 (-) Transcript_6246:796-1608(-)